MLFWTMTIKILVLILILTDFPIGPTELEKQTDIQPGAVNRSRSLVDSLRTVT